MNSKSHSATRAKSANIPVVAVVLLGILYCINAVGTYWPEWFWLTSQITNVHGNGNERMIALVEVVLWITSCISFIALGKKVMAGAQSNSLLVHIFLHR